MPYLCGSKICKGKEKDTEHLKEGVNVGAHVQFRMRSVHNLQKTIA
jgi:hypothetical protein